MKKNIIFYTIIIIVIVSATFFLDSFADKNIGDVKNLVEIGEKPNMSLIKAGEGVNVSVVTTENGNAVSMQWKKDTPLPKVVFYAGDDKWKLSNYKLVAADITNKGKEDIFVELQLAENGWYTGGQTISPGVTRTIEIIIQRVNEYPSYLEDKFIGMDALPGGILKAFWWSPLYADSINDVAILIIDPGANSEVLISNIRAEGKIDPPSEAELNNNYYPLVDEFGQFKHKEWRGKIHSLDELVKSKEIEIGDIKRNPPPQEWNKYGGWLKGPQLKATGHFRTEKIDGKWWFVDPEGRLFWANGMDEVSFGNSTVITEREHYFSNLPDSNKYGSFYSSSTRRIPKGYYKGVRTIRDFQITNWNLFRKYGENWKKEIEKITGSRLKSWGINNIGSYSNQDLIRASKIPYTSVISTGRAKRIEGSEGPWYKFPDPFDESFLTSLQNSFNNVKESAEDPYLIGFFVDNEFHWGNDSYLGKAVIQSGKDQAAKLNMKKYLENKYKTIQELNKNWEMSYKNWDDFMGSTALPVPEPPLVFGSSTKNSGKSNKIIKAYIDDTRAFSAIVANEYYTVIKNFLDEVIPDNLYLGSKFDFVYYPNRDTTGSWIVKLSSKYCDVIPFDRYSFTNSDFIPIDVDKPFIIAEWGMGALDAGLLHYGLRYADDQQNRAELYYNYVKSSLQNPFIIGVQWFKYYDQPVTGRTDGEDYNMGFLNICDIPYPEMVSSSRKLAGSMYSIRFSH